MNSKKLAVVNKKSTLHFAVRDTPILIDFCSSYLTWLTISLNSKSIPFLLSLIKVY